MKNKYVMIQGLAFSEKSDMNKLSSYAKQGWLLDSIKGGLFYKLIKGEPRDIVYSLDYQNDADDDYFALFEEAGWNHVLSTQDSIHIFSAPKGTEPIYSDSDSEKTKYMTVMETTKKGSIIFGILSLILIAMSVASGIYMRKLFLLSIILMVISWCIFIFNFMPFIAYRGRIKQIEKHGKCINDEDTRKIYIVNMVLGLGLLALGIAEFMKNKGVATSMIIIALINISMGCQYFTAKKKSKKR